MTSPVDSDSTVPMVQTKLDVYSFQVPVNSFSFHKVDPMEDSGSVPMQPPLNMGAVDKGTRGHFQGLPFDYVSYRVTTDDPNVVFDAFKGTCCVIADEVSKTGVRHFHIVVVGHTHHEMVKKRLTRAKLGVNKWWSKKNHGNGILEAISYTVKCGDYYTRMYCHELVEKAPDWVFGLSTHKEVAEAKDLDKDWMLTYNNVLRVAQNWRTTHALQTDKLSGVLAHMMEHSRWIPSPQMVKLGLNRFYHDMFTYRVTNVGKPPAWWEPRVEEYYGPSGRV